MLLRVSAAFIAFCLTARCAEKPIAECLTVTQLKPVTSANWLLAVKNSCARDFPEVHIYLRLLDRDGYTLARTSVTLKDIGAREKFRTVFQAPVNAHKLQVRKITEKAE